ncbi:hypothetical protein [Streptomonospora arabica]|uniref:Uncharacterized protein n=1 Tax=Streptomonospora arabica TaxID=412417 RepID=A0ABV9SMD8_9ACTN
MALRGGTRTRTPSRSKAGGLPPADPRALRWAAWSPGSAMVALIPRRRSSARLARLL